MSEVSELKLISKTVTNLHLRVEFLRLIKFYQTVLFFFWMQDAAIVTVGDGGGISGKVSWFAITKNCCVSAQRSTM